MAKNIAFIEQMKAAAKLKKQINKITPEVYAGIALALHRKQKWGYKRINELFMESQKIWDECVELDINMIELCERETGIEVKGLVE
jgi:hypothetical protein